VASIAHDRFELHFSIGQATHDRLRRAQEHLSDQIPLGRSGSDG